MAIKQISINSEAAASVMTYVANSCAILQSDVKGKLSTSFEPLISLGFLDGAVSKVEKQVDTLILVDKIKTINTKKGDKMAFLTGSDETGSMEYTLFPKVLEDYSKIKKGNLLKIRGRVEKRLNKYQIIVERIKDLENEKETK